MQEAYHHVLSTWAWGLVDEANVLALAFYECLGNAVFYGEGYVVNAFATLLKPFSHGAVGRCWLKELKFYLTHLQEGGLHFLVGYLLNGVALKSEYVLKEREHSFDALNTYSQVVYS